MDDDSLFYDIMLWIPKFFFLIVVTFVLLAIINAIHTQETHSQNVELQVILQSMYNSPNILAYQDNLTKRAYPGVIDLQKFNELNLDQVMESESRRFLIKVELINSSNSEILGTKYYTSGRESSRQEFETRLVVQNFEERIFTGPRVRKSVTILDDDEKYRGVLRFESYIEQ